MYYERFDSETKEKYSQLESSSLGLGIAQILTIDLDMYPDLTQN
jgi:hypothetical protein